jgi:hypothetical protein
MVRQDYDERNQYVTVHSGHAEGFNQHFLSCYAKHIPAFAIKKGLVLKTLGECELD